MKSKPVPLIAVLSKNQLRALIRIYGLQPSFLDKSQLIFAWESLEYQLRIADEKLYLEAIQVRMDVPIVRIQASAVIK